MNILTNISDCDIQDSNMIEGQVEHAQKLI